jgi:hypothetical protein
MWSSFKSGVLSIIEMHVPTKTSSSRYTHPWVSTDTRRLSRRKARAYTKTKSSKKKEMDKYKALKAETQREMHRAHSNFIKTTVNQDLTSNSKQFYSYIKSKKQEPAGISPLLNQDGFLHSSSTSKAEILNHQFHSVYTREDLSNIPNLGPSNIQSMTPIEITTPGVKKLLKKLKPKKDGIPNRLLILAADKLAPILTFIFQRSLDTEQYQQIGRKP